MPSDNLIGLVAVPTDAQGGVNPCWNLNRGISNAAHRGNAPFRLDVTFVYTTNGKVQSELQRVKLADTKEVGAFDRKSVLVEATFKLAAVPDKGTSITLTTQIEVGAPPEGDPVGEPATGTFPVT